MNHNEAENPICDSECYGCELTLQFCDLVAVHNVIDSRDPSEIIAAAFALISYGDLDLDGGDMLGVADNFGELIACTDRDGNLDAI